MELLEQAWEGVGNFFGGIMHGFERGVTAVFGSSNARYVRRLQARVEEGMADAARKYEAQQSGASGKKTAAE